MITICSILTSVKADDHPARNIAVRRVGLRARLHSGRTHFVYTVPMSSNQFGVSPSIINRSYTITAEIEVPQGERTACW
jgi:hypothetical protein